MASQLDTEEELQSLKDATKTALLEARAVLMALTTLFGFQLNVIFTATFKEDLSHTERLLHVVALTLGLLAIGVVMLPSAYGRQAEPRQVSRRMVRLISRTLTVAMAPLLISITIDFALILRMTLEDGGALPTVCATALGVYFAGLWFVYPRIRAVQLARRGLGPAKENA